MPAWAGSGCQRQSPSFPGPVMNAKARIFFFGDTHGSFEHCRDIVVAGKPDAVVFLGDIQAHRPLHEALQDIRDLTDVWWIHGNHDTDSPEFYHHLFDSELAARNLHARVIDIHGVRIAGLGGVFRGTIWNPNRPYWRFHSLEDYDRHSLAKAGEGGRGDRLRHRSSIFPIDYEALMNEKADILVLHEAPSCNCYGFAVLDKLATRLGVSRVFHGHHHDRYDYSTHFGRLGFEVYAVGLCGVANMTGEVIRRGDLDGQGQDRVAALPEMPVGIPDLARSD